MSNSEALIHNRKVFYKFRMKYWITMHSYIRKGEGYRRDFHSSQNLGRCSGLEEVVPFCKKTIFQENFRNFEKYLQFSRASSHFSPTYLLVQYGWRNLCENLRKIRIIFWKNWNFKGKCQNFHEIWKYFSKGRLFPSKFCLYKINWYLFNGVDLLISQVNLITSFYVSEIIFNKPTQIQDTLCNTSGAARILVRGGTP